MTSARSKHRRQRDTTAARRNIRAHDERVVEALEEARAAERRLDARIAREAQAFELAIADRTAAQRAAARAERVAAAQEAAHRRELYPLGFARSIVRQGYTVAHAVAFTGWPADMLDDVVAGQW